MPNRSDLDTSLEQVTHRINRDEVLSSQQISTLMGINISHHRDRIKIKHGEHSLPTQSGDDSSRFEYVLIIVLSVVLSVAIGLFSLGVDLQAFL
jgi:Flp pilus assembly protein TadB